ncbi:MAG TPA: hypothetical protein VKW09_13210 [bacterium]|nr:hypothetical protein [bacterium]
MDDAVWRQLWSALVVLETRARDLRRLSEEEPLKKPRPDYPHAGVGRAHDEELRGVFADLDRALTDVIRLLPAALPDGSEPAVGVVADETPAALARRLATLQKLTADLARAAFEPLPPLPPHAPPYLVTIPGHDLPSSKALALGHGLAETVTALRNALLAAANAQRP